jgi:SAM-dependent methyltransferase
MSGGAPDARGPAGRGDARSWPARIAEALLEQTQVYRLWQAPFAADKLRPVLRQDDLRRARRVLDVGCGPGTNTAHFQDADYVGIDINPRYVAWARRRHGREFLVADIRTYVFPEGQKFDFVLVNSFLHHVDAEEARRILEAVSRTLAPGGTAHILDLVLPERRSLARWLARHDRGRFARRLEDWRGLFGSIFEVTLLQPYTLSLLGVPLWNMVYCRGQARR